jgi:predicted kinase
MDSATLAVVGTLSGVVITATAALLGNLLTARQQRATTERQLLHTVDERLRTERREAFVDYFAAYSALREKIDITPKPTPRAQAV